MSVYSLNYIQDPLAVKRERKANMGWFFTTANAGQEQFRVTGDGVRIAASFFKRRRGVASRLVLVCPGFAKKKDGYPITDLCQYLTRFGDVLSIDFRGVGHSEGRYTFGAEEYQD